METQSTAPLRVPAMVELVLVKLPAMLESVSHGLVPFYCPIAKLVRGGEDVLETVWVPLTNNFP